ncbi:MAG: NAD-dependent dihydropyrimidine dehydrogenase subunit PreA, partial [Planctomycetota bacterium]
EKHGFDTLDDFRGHALPYFTTHADLVRRQAEAREAKKAAAQAAKDKAKQMITADEEWTGDDFVDQSDALARG